MAVAQVSASDGLGLECAVFVEAWCGRGWGWFLWCVTAVGGFNPFVGGMLRSGWWWVVEFEEGTWT